MAVSVAEHRHQGSHAGTAGDEEQGTTVRFRPGEVAADRSAQLQAVARAQLLTQVWGDFAVGDLLDGEIETPGGRGGGDRVGLAAPGSHLRR